VDYALVGIIVFFASFTGTVIAMSLGKGKSGEIQLPSPLKTVKEIIDKRTEKKEVKKGWDLQREWFEGQEKEEEVI